MISVVVSTRMIVDTSGKAQEKEGKEATDQCMKLLRLSGDEISSTYEKIWQSVPSYRYLGLCPHDASMVGMLLEMQAHLSFLYTANDKKRKCHVVVLGPPRDNLLGFSIVTPRNASRPTRIAEVNNRQSYTSSVIISEVNKTFCDNRTRKMGFYLDPGLGRTPWVLELTWRRKPEYYEDGEVGWSSVGAHPGALSGTFSLTKIQLSYSLASLSDDHSFTSEYGSTVVSGEIDRFRARAGDFYQCASTRHILLTTFLANSNGNKGNRTNKTSSIHVIFTTRNIRLQSFGDHNENTFSGAGVTCGDDVHEDHAVTIGIGSAVCIIVAVSVIGIALTRLYDRDKELQSYEAGYFKAAEEDLPPVTASLRRRVAKVPSGARRASPIS